MKKLQDPLYKMGLKNTKLNKREEHKNTLFFSSFHLKSKSI